ncbi:MAG: xanthine dehydrogenase family protein [Solirubrobacterales bacterium]|nr:xanthine dehydrogenase family protein [Solirubrobacterales bacterium]
MTVTAPPAAPQETAGRHVGAAVERIEDPRLLVGRGGFIDDLDPIPGALEAAIVRSPHAHARITAFDAARARRAPGVRCVIGPAEVAQMPPFPLTVKTPMPYRPAATDRVRYVGEPVAVVVATSRHLAEDAAELVAVEYEPLTAVVDVRAALHPDAPRLHDEADGNLATDRTMQFGELDGAFANADAVVEGSFSFPRYSSTPIETYGVVAHWEHDGAGDQVTAWCNFHGPFTMQPVIAGALGLAPGQVRLIVPEDIGGSFGIKSGVYAYVALLAIASRHAAAPVRWIEDRIEHLLASSAGNDREMEFAAAVDRDGRVRALRLDLIDNVGAYLRPPEPATLYRCFGNLTGAYAIDAVALRSRAVVTNKAPTGLNRGFGGQQLYFGLERLMDKIAARVGVDPVQLRRRNLIERDAFPYSTPTGGQYDSGDYEAVLDLAVARSGYEELCRRRDEGRRDGRLRGVGIATIVDPSGTNLGYVSIATPPERRVRGREKSGSTEHVRVSVDAGGEVTVILGSTPQGQGHRTVARQVVADRLGIDVEHVHARVEMDTATTPWTVSSGSYSSRFAPLTTSAAIAAADRVAEVLRRAAAVLLECEAGELELAGGQIRVAAEPERAVLFRHAAGLVHWDPGMLDGEALLYADAAYTPPQSRHATTNDEINSSLCYGFVADVVAVEVDPETLEVRVEAVTSVHDCGTVLNPLLVEGQTSGSIAHGLGGATLEELRYGPDGQMVAASFMDYLCPTAAELGFEVTFDHVVTPSPHTPLGAKGAAEGSTMSIPVALANAVSDALAPLGVEIDRLPVHGTVIHELLANRQKGSEWR